MKRRVLVFLLMLAGLALWAAPARAAEEAGDAANQANSPLYSVNQGLITGIATITIFVLLLAVLGRFAWGPIVKGLAAREKKIRGDIADAEAAHAKAEAMLRDYNQQLANAEARSHEIISKARADADALAAQIRARSQQDAEEARERATKDIEAAKNQAIREIHEQAAELATSAAEKIIRRSLNANDYRDLVNRSLEQMETVGR